MDGENLISWNIPNFVSFVFMIAIIWVVIGTAGHLLVRRGGASGAPSATNNTYAPGGVAVA